MNELDYKMTKKMFDSILSMRTQEEEKQNPYSYVINLINETYGLKGNVTHVSIFDI